MVLNGLLFLQRETGSSPDESEVLVTLLIGECVHDSPVLLDCFMAFLAVLFIYLIGYK
jgi:hypothetical protein